MSVCIIINGILYMLMRLTYLFIVLTFPLLVFSGGISSPASTTNHYKNEPILPIPLTISLDARKVKLGERLFNDPQLSHNNLLACSNCHQLLLGGDDGLARSITNQGKPDLINAPTVFNSVYNFRQTWRGAFRTLELQAEADLKNPRHGATTWDELLPKLIANVYYKKTFHSIYPEGITRKTVLNAIATFEKSLITPNSRFDQYLRGDESAITNDEKKGYLYFKQYGCIACHQGVNVGGNLFQKFGLFADYFSVRGNIKKADYGRFNVTGEEKDRFVFRVPSLRNVGVTAPYLHDGSLDSLRKTIEFMAIYQLGTTLPDEHVIKLELFLNTLTGEYKGQSLFMKEALR